MKSRSILTCGFFALQLFSNLFFGQSIIQSDSQDLRSLEERNLLELIDNEIAAGNLEGAIPLYDRLLNLPISDSTERVNHYVAYHDLLLKLPTSSIAQRESILSRARHILPLRENTEGANVAFLNSLAKEALTQGDFIRGASILNSVESILERAKEFSIQRAGTLLNLGGLYVDQRLFQLSIPLLTKALAIIDSIPTPPAYSPSVNYSLGRSFLLAGRCEDAIEAFQDSRSGFIALFGSPMHPAILSIDSYVSLCYVRCGREQKALELQNSLLPLYNTFYSCPNPESATFFGEIFNTYSELGMLDSASHYHRLALECANLDSLDLASLLSSEQESANLLLLISQRIRLCESDIELDKFINLGISYIQILRNCALHYQELVEINAYSRPFISSCLKQLIASNEFRSDSSLNIFLFLIDFAKSWDISIENDSAADKLRSILNNRNDSLFLLSQTDILQNSDITLLALEVDSLSKELKALLSNKVPGLLDYKQLATRYSAITDFVSSESVILDLFANETDIFCLALSKGYYKIVQYAFSDGDYFEILNRIRDMQEGVSNSNVTISLPFLDSLDLDKFASISIASDSWLHSIPFDVVNYDSDYLIKKFAIGYIPTVKSLLQTDSQRQTRSISTSSIFNPLYTPITTNSQNRSFDDTFEPLPFAKQEAEFVSNIIPGSSLFSSESVQKDIFFSHLVSDQLLHFSMHAYYNYLSPSSSAMVLSSSTHDPSSFVYMQELENLSLNNELIFLSGCESGTGILHDGIGLMSMSNTLLNAGAKSVVSTSWTVDDQPTYLIVKYFYEALNNGENKASALRTAKLKYLSEHPELGVNPFYWASLRVDGDTAPLYFKNSIFSTTYLLFIAFLFLVVGALIFIKRK